MDWPAGAQSAFALFFCFFEGSLSGRAAGRLPSGAPCTAGTDGLDGAVVCGAQGLVAAATAIFGSSVVFLVGFAAAGVVGARHCVWPCCMWTLDFFFFSTRGASIWSLQSECAHAAASQRVAATESCGTDAESTTTSATPLPLLISVFLTGFFPASECQSTLSEMLRKKHVLQPYLTPEIVLGVV